MGSVVIPTSLISSSTSMPHKMLFRISTIYIFILSMFCSCQLGREIQFTQVLPEGEPEAMYNNRSADDLILFPFENNFERKPPKLMRLSTLPKLYKMNCSLDPYYGKIKNEFNFTGYGAIADFPLFRNTNRDPYLELAEVLWIVLDKSGHFQFFFMNTAEFSKREFTMKCFMNEARTSIRLMISTNHLTLREMSLGIKINENFKPFEKHEIRPLEIVCSVRATNFICASTRDDIGYYRQAERRENPKCTQLYDYARDLNPGDYIAFHLISSLPKYFLYVEDNRVSCLTLDLESWELAGTEYKRGLERNQDELSKLRDDYMHSLIFVRNLFELPTPWVYPVNRIGPVFNVIGGRILPKNHSNVESGTQLLAFSKYTGERKVYHLLNECDRPTFGLYSLACDMGIEKEAEEKPGTEPRNTISKYYFARPVTRYYIFNGVKFSISINRLGKIYLFMPFDEISDITPARAVVTCRENNNGARIDFYGKDGNSSENIHGEIICFSRMDDSFPYSECLLRGNIFLQDNTEHYSLSREKEATWSGDFDYVVYNVA